MKASFTVHGRSYEVEIFREGRSEDEKFEICRALVEGQVKGSVQGRLKLTTRALELAGERAEKEGGSAEEWLVRGCSLSLASEILIRKLEPDFSFVIDHRWVADA